MDFSYSPSLFLMVLHPSNLSHMAASSDWNPEGAAPGK